MNKEEGSRPKSTYSPKHVCAQRKMEKPAASDDKGESKCKVCLKELEGNNEPILLAPTPYVYGSSKSMIEAVAQIRQSSKVV